MPNPQFYLPIIHESTALLYNTLNLPNYSTYNAAERDELILNYWDDPEDIQYYPIGFRTIERMFDKSFDNQTIALHVTNIADKNKVDIEWIPVKTKTMGSVQVYDFALEISVVQHYYFILKRAYYDNATIPNTIATKGMKASTKDSGNIIFATLGKVLGGDYCVFANAATLTIIDGTGGTGGNGYTPGAKVPAPPPPPE